MNQIISQFINQWTHLTSPFQYFSNNFKLLLGSVFVLVDLNLSVKVSPKYGNVCVRARNEAYLGAVSGSSGCQSVTFLFSGFSPKHLELSHRLHGLQVASEPVIFRLLKRKHIRKTFAYKTTWVVFVLFPTFVYETRWVVKTSTVLPSHWIRAIPTWNIILKYPPATHTHVK